MRPEPTQFIHGRGASSNPGNRFERIHLEPSDDPSSELDPGPATEFLKDSTAAIINFNDSPDLGFKASLNPYRGCEHGCIYCYARPTHEYLGYSAGIDFESRILVKERAPELLRAELSAKRWQPQVIMMSGVTDCYQPIERRLRLTRRCLEVLAEFRNPVGLITKNHLITRDIDLFQNLAQHNAVAVYISLTTLDATLTPKLEPRASLPNHRLAAIRALRAAGIPVGVMLAPLIPGLNDHEIPRLLEAAKEAGAQTAGYVPIRLPFGVSKLFEDWLAIHFPDRKENVLNRIRDLRGGKLNDARFGSRMRGEGHWAAHMESLFDVASRKMGLNLKRTELSTSAFRVPSSASESRQSMFPF